jgi:predicted Zn-dependent protease
MKRKTSAAFAAISSACLVVLLAATVGACSGLASVGAVGAKLAGATGLISQDAADALSAGLASYAESAKAAENLTPENEYYIGRAVAANITVQYKVDTSNSALQIYLNKICSAIAVNSPKPEIYGGYHVAVLDTDEINALSTPGGHIFVTKGLLACTSSEDEIASVLAHELAHVQLSHGLTSIRNARYIAAAKDGVIAGASSATGADLEKLAGVFADSISEIVVTITSKGYAKEQEYEADATALSLLASAGYEPSAITGMLHQLEAKTVASSGFGKTHPAPADRITQVNKNIGKYTVADTTAYRKKRYAAVKK